MKKNNIILLGLIAFLLIVIVIFTLLNQEGLDHRKVLSDEAKLEIHYNNEILYVYDFDEIIDFEAVKFMANLKEDGRDALEQNYTGVLLKHILEHIGFLVSDIDAVIVSAVDGYTVVIEQEKLAQDDNVYLAYKLGEEYLKPREQGGPGPYQVIISNDPFSQFWVKYAIKIEIKDK